MKRNVEALAWPLGMVGDEKFFGYIVGIGIVEEVSVYREVSVYAEFEYNGEITRYTIPNDEDLIDQLFEFLKLNLAELGGGIYGKVWIKRTANGYAVHLP